MFGCPPTKLGRNDSPVPGHDNRMFLDREDWGYRDFSHNSDTFRATAPSAK